MRRKSQSGTVIILVSLAMLLIIALAALAIDINQAYTTRQRLSKASDLAATSAAVWLPDQTSITNSASATAKAVAKANGATSLTVTFPNPGEVRVAMQKATPYFFAPVLGVRNKVVGAGATAASRGGKIVPLGFQDIPRVPGTQYVFTWKDLALGILGPADWVAMRIGGVGPANFRNRLQNSFAGNYPKGAGRPTETSLLIPVFALDGIVFAAGPSQAIFEQAALPPWNDNGMTYAYPNYPEGNPRIVTVALITQPLPFNSNVTINRFGSMYLRDYAIVGGAGKGKGKGGGAPGVGTLTAVWLGEYTAVAGSPDRGWFANKGVTRLSR